jgi:14-3-3 protein epsilon
VDLKSPLSNEERQIFGAAYKTYCGERKMNLRDCN